MTVTVITLSGSTRQGSVNTKLAAAFATICGGLGANAKALSLADFTAPLYDPDWESENGVPDTIKALGEVMHGADAAFIASPEYNSGITPLLKNTMDWLSRLKPHPFKDTLFSLGGASPGAMGGIRALPALRTSLVGLNAIVMPEQLTVGGAMQAFGEDGRFANERSAEFAKLQAERLIEVAAKLRG